MRIPIDTNIGVVGAGVSGLLLTNELIQRGYKVQLIGPKDHKNQLLGTWRSTLTPEPQCDYVVSSWKAWDFCFAGQAFSHVGSHYRYEVIDGKAMRLGLEKTLDSDANCTRHFEQVVGISQTDFKYIATLEGNGAIDSLDFLVDTRPPERATGCCIQQFFGFYLEASPREINLMRPLIMDYPPAADQLNESVFIYALPISEQKVLIEATIFDVEPRDQDYFVYHIEKWLRGRKKEDLLSSVLEKEGGLLPMGETVPRFRIANSFGTAGGGTRPSTGYTLLGIEQQISRINNWTVSEGIPKFEYSRLAKFMDAKFLNVLRNEPHNMRQIFHKMAERMNGDEFANFLSDNFPISDAVKLIYKLPKTPFIRNYFG